MSRRACSWLALIAAVSLSACARGASLPAGVIVDPTVHGSKIGGIYPTDPSDPSCCWVARDSSFRVRKGAAEPDFALEIFVPNLQMFRTDPQGFTVTFDDRYQFQRCCFGPGVHTVLYRLPPELSARGGTIGVRVRARRAFVPSRSGVGPDNRELAFILVSAGFTSFMHGRF